MKKEVAFAFRQRNKKVTKNDKVLTGELGMSMYHIIKQHDLFHTIIWLGLSHLIFMVYVGFTCNFCTERERESRLMIGRALSKNNCFNLSLVLVDGVLYYTY